MFIKRLLSGIVLVCAIAWLFFAGGWQLWAGLLVISLLGMYELYSTVGVQRKRIGLAGYLCGVFYACRLLLSNAEVSVAYLLLILVVVMTVYVFSFPEFSSDQVMLVFFGVIYVPVMLFNLYRLRLLDEGYLVWLVILGSWGSDTCAYCVGMKLGQRRLTPILSPKKSVEGAIGGVCGAALLGLLFGLIFAAHLTVLKYPPLSCMVIGAVSAVIAQIGDLTASAIKRNHDIKDFGNLIPGHGGILDRFDSVIFVAPVIYYLTVLLAA